VADVRGRQPWPRGDAPSLGEILPFVAMATAFAEEARDALPRLKMSLTLSTRLQQRSEGEMDTLWQAAAHIMRPGVVQRETFLFAGTVILAALLFTVGGIFMKLSEGLTKFWPTMTVFALFVTGAALQALAMKREDLAVTYLVVVGLEAILAFLFGVLVFSESCTPARIAGRSAHRRRHHLVALGPLRAGCAVSGLCRHPLDLSP